MMPLHNMRCMIRYTDARCHAGLQPRCVWSHAVHAGRRTRVTSMGGLYGAATLHALRAVVSRIANLESCIMLFG